ncbi:sensor histidine kinase [Streptomyces poonensis]|uniref:histidine kinase n=1 Tax=Streptomyces poonensis TaxID=68255 RepID=A0A918PAP1_9ACTN|nr:ATP-binding protein [Streptomyces poonensis]GGY94925.1 hypothetical protein GCM10010365_12170 [Streptomyces poonensis]GLJ88748.1 hypothetical protein GCM10017589_13480 [Streptomyces poonensis]
MTSPTLPGERPTVRSLLPASLLTAVLGALAVTSAVVVAPDSVRVPLALGGSAAALLLCVAVAMAVHGIQSARVTRRRLEAVTQDVGRLVQERALLAEDSQKERARLAGELTHERNRLTAELDQERARLNREHAADRVRLVEEHTEEIARLSEEHATELALRSEDHAAEITRLSEEHTAERTRLTEENARLTTRLREATGRRAAALSATANAAGRMQALATSMLADLRAMEERHTDEDVLTDLLHLDHRTAQAGRLADSIAVLTGARSGRRWARPIGMESILRGAMGRISGYQRVRVHSASEAAVAGHAAEGVMHALAELLDNAANFSPPTAEVHVYVEEVPAGVIVSVEDSGLVMGEVQLRRAERTVAGEGEAAELGGLTGTRLGLAVVGRLARRYGMKVSYRPSARGGTGVLMLIPQDILVPQDATGGFTVPAVRTVPDSPASSSSSAWDTSAVPAVEAAPAVPALPAPPALPADLTAAPLPATAWPATPPAPSPWTSATPGASGTYGVYGASDADLPRRRATPSATGPETGSDLSYAASLAGTDLDPDPVPTHESPDPSADEGPLELPRRRRGRTLAEAERALAATRSAAPRTPPTPEEMKARAARFSSFRRAVRNAPDQATADPTTADPAQGSAPAVPGTAGPDTAGPGAATPASRPADNAPTTPHSDPEGDTTS